MQMNPKAQLSCQYASTVIEGNNKLTVEKTWLNSLVRKKEHRARPGRVTAASVLAPGEGLH
jgi:hypothetical protein